MSEKVVPIEPNAKNSVENVLSVIKLRGRRNFKLTSYTYSADCTKVTLKFEKCGDSHDGNGE